MRAIAIALFAEGPTDHSFLTPVIESAAEQLLCREARVPVELVPVISISRAPDLDAREQILCAAKKADGADILVVHQDAEGRDAQRVHDTVFSPALRLLRETPGPMCRNIAPLVPVKMTEAWMLSDPDALCELLGIRGIPEGLDFPVQPHQVEAVSDPKETLRAIIRAAYGGRGKPPDPGRFYEPLGRSINHARLQQVPSHQAFLASLRQCFAALKLL